MTCLKPMYFPDQQQFIPCARCAGCLQNRISQWAFRLMQEEKYSTTSDFVTLTYDWENVPITSDRRLTVSKRDLQLFIKRLRQCQRRKETKYFKRKKLPRSSWTYSKLKYYGVSEYGGRTSRPHYHLILFNADRASVESAWTMGTVHFGYVTSASVGYTLKYLNKTSRIGLSPKDTRKPVFSLMSTKLGINYLTPQMMYWHKNDLQNRMYVQTRDKVKISMPRYYKLKIYEQQEKDQIANQMLLESIEKLYVEAVEDFDRGNVSARFRRNIEDRNAANKRHTIKSLQLEKS